MSDSEMDVNRDCVLRLLAPTHSSLCKQLSLTYLPFSTLQAQGGGWLGELWPPKAGEEPGFFVLLASTQTSYFLCGSDGLGEVDSAFPVLLYI